MIKKRKDKGYFCLCEKCGNISWMDESVDGAVFNCLEIDGTMLIPRDFISVTINQAEFKQALGKKLFSEFTCAICERKVNPIGFSKVRLDMRKNIVKMSPEQRKEWLGNFKMVEELEK